MNRLGSIVVVALAALLLGSLTSCKDESTSQMSKSGKGFYVEEVGILVPSLHGFEKVDPELKDTREVFLLQRGESYIWVGRIQSLLSGTSVEKQLGEMWFIAQDRYNSVSFLPGVQLMHGNIEKVEHPLRPYVDHLIVLERTPEAIDAVNEMDRLLHAHEFKRIPMGRKMIMEILLTAVGDTVYLFTFLSPVEDHLFLRDDALAVFRDLKLEVPMRPSGY